MISTFSGKKIRKFFNSRDRLSGSSHNFTVDIGTFGRPKSLRLLSTQIPFTTYNIRDDLLRTNKIEIKELGVVNAISVPSGTYRLIDFPEVLSTTLTTNSTNGYQYTVSFDTATLQYTIECDNPFDLILTTGDHLGTFNTAVQLGFIADQTAGSSYTGMPVVVTEISIVDNGKNNVMNFNEPTGAGEFTVIIPPGAYTSTTLTTTLNTSIISPSGYTYTVVYDSTTFRFTISCTNAFEILFQSGGYNNMNMGYILGYDTSADKTGMAVYLSDYAANIGRESVVILTSDLMLPGKDYAYDSTADIDLGIIEIIPIKVNSGGVIYYEHYDSSFTKVVPQKPPFITSETEATFMLKYPAGYDFDLNGADWTMTMEFQY